ncbi:MAG: D-glycerate dehydrogenase [Patescibacteria group bacterium]
MKKIYVTRIIPESALNMLRNGGHEVDVNPEDRVLSKEELISALNKKEYDAVLSLLTDKIDADVFNAAPNAKIFANFAVGYNNMDVEEAKKRGITITNTPEVLTNTVAEHAFALMMAIAARIVEGDAYTRAGKFKSWEPMLLLGTDLTGKTLGILGAGRIGSRVAHHGARGFDMNVIYYDVKRNDAIEKNYGASFRATPEEVLKEADFVSVHVPLLPTTTHLIDESRLKIMKKTAYLVNTSRGPVVDEAALVSALKEKIIAGAALDVFEHEPELSPGLKELSNVIITPHIASATFETRVKMAELAAKNIIQFLDGGAPENRVN